MLGLKLNHVSKRGSWQLSLIINHAAVLQNIPLCPYSYSSMVTIDFNTAYIHEWTDVFFAMPQFKQAVCMLNKEWCCLRLNVQVVGYPIAKWIVLTSQKLTGYREVAPTMTARWHAISLSGVPDFFDRNKILSGGDLSHYQVPHCIRVFFYFVWFVFIHHNFQFYFELCTYCNILDIYLS